MKYKLGLLHEPIANPVNLMEIYEKVKYKEQQTLEESIIVIPLEIKKLQKHKTTAHERYIKYKVYHTNYDNNKRLRKQIFKTMKNRLRCPRCNQVYYIASYTNHGKKALKEHYREFHSY